MTAASSSRSQMPKLLLDRQIACWQGRIAAGVNGSGLDVYKGALIWVKQTVPPENGLREEAKQEIQGATERHFGDVQAPAVLEAIYFDVFPEDAASDDALDADIYERDKANDTTAEIERLAKL
jgi:hypothetical protein